MSNQEGRVSDPFACELSKAPAKSPEPYKISPLEPAPNSIQQLEAHGNAAVVFSPKPKSDGNFDRATQMTVKEENEWNGE